MRRPNADVVAIVDDDDDVSEVLQGLLEIVGYQVETYRSGRQFLIDLEPGRLGCLVVDQNMPHMTGLEMLARIDSRGLAIPTILITGAPNLGLVRQALDLGVMKVLEKPMSHRELLRLVEFSVN
jgi:FixJ family two-component response regulator